MYIETILKAKFKELIKDELPNAYDIEFSDNPKDEDFYRTCVVVQSDEELNIFDINNKHDRIRYCQGKINCIIAFNDKEKEKCQKRVIQLLKRATKEHG
jgi:hypothetical protein